MSGVEQQPRGKVDVQHTFNGDLTIQHGTFERRMKIKRLLVNLQEQIQSLVGIGSQVDVAADIKINVVGATVAKHAYSVTISENADFYATGPASSAAAQKNSLFVDSDSSVAAGWGEKHQAHSPPQSQVPDSLAGGNFSHLGADRPNKRQHADGHHVSRTSIDLTAEHSPLEAMSRTPSVAGDGEIQPPVKLPHIESSQLQPNSVTTARDIMTFLHEWRNQWKEQGGWMYDQFRTLFDQEQRKKAWTEHKLDALQNTIGSSLGLQQTTTAHELNNISKLIPWLESCRKAAADISQAREEKWRITSATFHDQARKDRETAEKKIMEEIKAQRRGLKKQQKMIDRLLDAQGLANDGEEDV